MLKWFSVIAILIGVSGCSSLGAMKEDPLQDDVSVTSYGDNCVHLK